MDDYYPATEAGPGYEEGEDHEMDQEDAGPAQEDSGEVLQGCLEKFGSSDFIMEPEIFSQLKK